jgi:hypothetical protein
MYAQYSLRKRVWDALTADQQFAYLVTATTMVDRLRYVGEKADSAQVLAFPRAGQTVVPQGIIEAVIELAMALADGVDAEMELHNVPRIANTYGTLKTVQTPAYTPRHISAGIPCMEAWVRLVPYMVDANAIQLRAL